MTDTTDTYTCGAPGHPLPIHATKWPEGTQCVVRSGVGTVPYPLREQDECVGATVHHCLTHHVWGAE